MKKINYDGLNITKGGFLHNLNKINNRYYFKYRNELNFKTKKEAIEFFENEYENQN